MTSTAKRQIHLAAHFPGVNSTTTWGDLPLGSQIDFGSFIQLAQVAEAAKFDLVFMVDSPFITPDTAPQRAAAGG